ncbi:MAG TPA: DNA polymerase III subunit gamma/tau [Actinomycetota bacterium]|nr:DNA polymerase III subunit gamma/tau [Actinomycetota bacterium]
MAEKNVTSGSTGARTERSAEQVGPHQALYRRYRPQTPAELIGQDHVVRALTGAVREDRLHHAFLFCGPRGTGKTSTARILAKMVNCVNAPTAEPCDVCEGCVAVRDGIHVDVVEIDAASHGGVDDARELREKAPTAPMVGREKVYIIDEAQRLSREAFDALLKLFEEPPPGVRFVLATTEPHKMPATIVGRCQRFDFRRLSLEQLADHLTKIAEAEGRTLVPTAAAAIARQAEGSARDALSLLDQASVLGGETVDDDTVRALLGAPKGEIRFELADVVAIGDVKGAFEVVNRLVQDGQDLRNVTGEALAHFRNLLLAKTAPGQDDLIDVPVDAYEALRVQAEKLTTGELARVIALLLAAQNDMRWTTSPRLSLELALVRACLPDTDPSPAALTSRIERLERLANVAPGAVVPPADAGGPEAPGPADEVVVIEPAEPPAAAMVEADEAPPAPSDASADAPSDGPEAPVPAANGDAPSTQMPVPHAADAGSLDVGAFRRSWNALHDHVGQMRQPVLKAILESATPVSYDGTTLELAFPPDKRFGVQRVMDRHDVLRQAIQDVFGVSPTIACVVRESRDPVGGPAAVEVVEEDEVPDDAEALRRVQEMLGAQPIRDAAAE